MNFHVLDVQVPLGPTLGPRSGSPRGKEPMV